MTDDQLIRGCIKNNVVAQRHLYEKYHPKMLGVCIRYASSREEAQDILQEGFIKIFKKMSTFKRQGSLEGWIRKIIANTALEHYRKTTHLKQNIALNLSAGYRYQESKSENYYYYWWGGNGNSTTRRYYNRFVLRLGLMFN